MKLRSTRTGIFVAAILAVGLVSAGSGTPHYKFATIDVPGSNNTSMYGVTNEGLVTGYTIDPNGTGHGVLWAAGKMKVVDYPGQGTTGLYLYQANDAGLVAGGYYDVNGIGHAVIYNSNTHRFTSLPDITGASFNAAGGITNNGQTSGNFTLDPTQVASYVAWLFGSGPALQGQYHDFIAPNSDQAIFGTITQGMNDALTISGYYFDANNIAHGFIKPFNKQVVQIDIPGADNTECYAINNFGAITGRYMINGIRHGFILVNGKVYTIDYPGAAQTWIAGINDAGCIAGFYIDAFGNTHGFVAKQD